MYEFKNHSQVNKVRDRLYTFNNKVEAKLSQLYNLGLLTPSDQQSIKVMVNEYANGMTESLESIHDYEIKVNLLKYLAEDYEATIKRELLGIVQLAYHDYSQRIINKWTEKVLFRNAEESLMKILKAYYIKIVELSPLERDIQQMIVNFINESDEVFGVTLDHSDEDSLLVKLKSFINQRLKKIEIRYKLRQYKALPPSKNFSNQN
ncbi:MAG: hypothetical protein AB4057_10920 [Crocosphaera sp.]